MHILTRGDLDGLTCCALLTEAESIQEIRFAHPKDCQDGKVVADEQCIVANLPFILGCGMWFDHHASEGARLPDRNSYRGRFEMAPSCARVIYNHYQSALAEKFARFAHLLEETDRLDSAQLTMEDVERPAGWILLGMTLDPRSGMGAEFHKYFRWLVEFVKEVPLEKVLRHPEVKKRTDRVLQEQEVMKALLAKHARLEGGVIVTDLRGLPEKPVGNRFLVYAMFPEAYVELRIFDGHQGGAVVAVGQNIFNRPCPLNIGTLLSGYGGGGHAGAGTAQFTAAEAEGMIGQILYRLKAFS